MSQYLEFAHCAQAVYDLLMFAHGIYSASVSVKAVYMWECLCYLEQLAHQVTNLQYQTI